MTLSDVNIMDVDQVDGVWRGVLVLDGKRWLVDRSQGSWRFTPANSAQGWMEVSPSMAARLQEHVKRLERKERVAR